MMGQIVMNFRELLHSLKTEAPKAAYALVVDNDVFQKPILLSEQEVRFLIDFAIEHQPEIEFQGTTVPMLTFLMSLGTQETEHQNDLVLGLKDPRFEAILIEKAEQKVRETVCDGSVSVLFGLSANPPTIGHLLFIKHLLTQYAQIHIVLNAQSPLKKNQEDVSSNLRLEMLSEMLKAEQLSLHRCLIERVEIDRAPPSRMVATLSLLILSATQPSRWLLVLGLDVLFHFHNWYQWSRIGALCDLKFYPRTGFLLEKKKIMACLHRMIEHDINITLVYDTMLLKAEYEDINACLKKPVQVVYEKTELPQSASTDLRRHYADTNVSSGVPSTIHPVVDAQIRRLKLYGFKG